MKNKFNKGFTLIELLVVIAIIGMLAATVMTSLGSARSKARDAKRTSDLQNITLALTLYSDANGGKVPASLDALVSSKFIQNKPMDPLASEYGYAPFKANNSACTGTEVCTKYKLGALFENDAPILKSSCNFQSSGNGYDLANCNNTNFGNGGVPDNGGTLCMTMSNYNGWCK